MAVAKLVLSDINDPIFVGDTWDGFTMVYSDKNSLGTDQVNLTGATIRMTLNSDTGGTIALSSTTGGFTITSPTTGTFVCNPINRMSYPEGTYNGDLEITLSNTTRYTPILVQMYLKEDVTK